MYIQWLYFKSASFVAITAFGSSYRLSQLSFLSSGLRLLYGQHEEIRHLIRERMRSLAKLFKEKEAHFSKIRNIKSQSNTLNLNKVIDVNFYPTEKARRSNMRHRPVGVGVQGLADVFIRIWRAWLGSTSKTKSTPNSNAPRLLCITFQWK